MKRFIEGENRTQSTLFPESLDEYIAPDNAVRIVDAFVNKLDLQSAKIVDQKSRQRMKNPMNPKHPTRCSALNDYL